MGEKFDRQPEGGEFVPLEMYEISGHKKLLEEHIDRYCRARSRVQPKIDELHAEVVKIRNLKEDSAIVEVLSRAFESNSVDVRFAALQRLKELSREHIEELFLCGRKSSNAHVRREILLHLRDVSESTAMAHAREIILHGDTQDVQALFSRLKDFPMLLVLGILREVFEKDSQKITIFAAYHVWEMLKNTKSPKLSSGEREMLREKFGQMLLKAEISRELLPLAYRSLGLLSQKDLLTFLITHAQYSPKPQEYSDINSVTNAVMMLSREDRMKFLEEVVLYISYDVLLGILLEDEETLSDNLRKKISSRVEKDLEFGVYRAGNMLMFLEEHEAHSFAYRIIERVLLMYRKGDYISCAHFFEESADVILRIGDRSGRRMLLEMEKTIMSCPDEELKRGYFSHVHHAGEAHAMRILRRGLSDASVHVRRVVYAQVKHLPEELQASFLKEALALHKEEVIEAKLYQQSTKLREGFSRMPFAKTGSETVLLGGALHRKIILRKISLGAFSAWKNVYEDAAFWKGIGFSYVPIEPIVSYTFDGHHVCVASGVLDMNLWSWMSTTSLFRKDLEHMLGRIEAGLSFKGISHGHTHLQNFCLRFFRKEDGEIDVTRCPRLYLIDFDQAIDVERFLKK